MHSRLYVTVAASLFLLTGSLASSSAQEVAACKAPSAIQSTHTMIPYPPVSRRMGERGGSRFTVSIGADGGVTDVAVTTGSGSKRLDDTAAAHIKSHYRWQSIPVGCKPSFVEIVVNWWLDPLPTPTAIAVAGEGVEVIDVRAPHIDIHIIDTAMPVQKP
jgi:TonB family protein